MHVVADLIVRTLKARGDEGEIWPRGPRSPPCAPLPAVRDSWAVQA